eukprot:5993805-Amphidinium_carterae.1
MYWVQGVGHFPRSSSADLTESGSFSDSRGVMTSFTPSSFELPIPKPQSSVRQGCEGSLILVFESYSLRQAILVSVH